MANFNLDLTPYDQRTYDLNGFYSPYDTTSQYLTGDYGYSFNPNISSSMFSQDTSNGSGFWDNILSGFNQLGTSLDSAGTSLSNILTKPFGTGKNATTYGQLGLNALGMIQNQRNMNKALEEARAQFNWQKDLSRSNFQNQGTNYLNQSLWQLQSLNAFDPSAGAKRASDLSAGVSQLNDAANRIGIGGAFQQQADAIAKYNTLKPTVGA